MTMDVPPVAVAAGQNRPPKFNGGNVHAPPAL